MLKGAFAKLLWMVPSTGRVHAVPGNGGLVRFTSFCGRHASGVTPSEAFCVTFGVSAGFAANPLTPGHEPNKLSKLWFSS